MSREGTILILILIFIILIVYSLKENQIFKYEEYYLDGQSYQTLELYECLFCKNKDIEELYYAMARIYEGISDFESKDIILEKVRKKFIEKKLWR